MATDLYWPPLWFSCCFLCSTAGFRFWAPRAPRAMRKNLCALQGSDCARRMTRPLGWRSELWTMLDLHGPWAFLGENMNKLGIVVPLDWKAFRNSLGCLGEATNLTQFEQKIFRHVPIRKLSTKNRTLGAGSFQKIKEFPIKTCQNWTKSPTCWRLVHLGPCDNQAALCLEYKLGTEPFQKHPNLNIKIHQIPP